MRSSVFNGDQKEKKVSLRKPRKTKLPANVVGKLGKPVKPMPVARRKSPLGV
jgi:hypothetical protein